MLSALTLILIVKINVTVTLEIVKNKCLLEGRACDYGACIWYFVYYIERY